MKFDYKSNDIL